MEELFSKKQPEYPWQLELPPWAPAASMTEAERRADHARRLFDSEKARRDEGAEGHRGLFYDEGKDLFRSSDGTFALSQERANWPALKEKGFNSRTYSCEVHRTNAMAQHQPPLPPCTNPIVATGPHSRVPSRCARPADSSLLVVAKQVMLLRTFSQ